MYEHIEMRQRDATQEVSQQHAVAAATREPVISPVLLSFLQPCSQSSASAVELHITSWEAEPTGGSTRARCCSQMLSFRWRLRERKG